MTYNINYILNYLVIILLNQINLNVQLSYNESLKIFFLYKLLVKLFYFCNRFYRTFSSSSGFKKYVREMNCEIIVA